MKTLSIIIIFLFSILNYNIGQSVMTAELLWQLGRVSPLGLSLDEKSVIYQVTHFNADENTSSKKYYKIAITGGEAEEVLDYGGLMRDKNISPNGKYKLSYESVKIRSSLGKDRYSTLDKSNVYIYDDLMYRHWDTWSNGSYNHVLLSSLTDESRLDIMKDQPYHCPTQPFGGNEDYIWSPSGKEIIYVTKPKVGQDYAQSTNTDLFSYHLETKKTINITESNAGYDAQPAFSSQGKLAWLCMKRDGYESDKNDIIIRDAEGNQKNATAYWDGTVSSFHWGSDGNIIYFVAPIQGTRQLFAFNLLNIDSGSAGIRQITKGQFDVRGIVGQSGSTLIVTRGDMNHATEIYSVALATGKMLPLSHVNDEIYNSIHLSPIKKRYTTTTDGKTMLSWVIYPPNFDSNKNYPTLLYCQGGPQGALSQFYSYRWNFQLMAAHGYIIIAPNRRGMPGYGVDWNEQISKDYGGQNMKDYLAAIDDIVEEPYVAKDRLGAVGASYGGYSVFYLAGIHQKRFKTFISHDGMFNLRSMYGTTEELFFVNWDLGGPYWDEKNEAAQKSFTEFNPINKVGQWDTPILIYQGGKDFRIPIGQGLEAFQAAQLRGIKSRIVYLPDENHWVLSAQNGLVWQHEFFRWLNETL